MKKIIFLGIALLAAGQFMVAQTFQMIAVSADGDETTYPVSTVQKVVFENNTMTVKMKAEDDATNITCIKFSQDTGIKEQKSESSFFVFPNPVIETLTVNGIKKGAIINLYDMSGALLKTVISQDNVMNINVSSMQPGMYLLQIDKQVIKFLKK